MKINKEKIEKTSRTCFYEISNENQNISFSSLQKFYSNPCHGSLWGLQEII